MLAPRIAQPNTKEAASSSSELAIQRPNRSAGGPAHGTAEQLQMLQRTIGNQATMRLLAQRAEDRRVALSTAEQVLMLQRAVGNQATMRLLAQRANTATANEPGSQGSAPGRSWDFSEVPVVPPGCSKSLGEGLPFSTPPLPGVIQPKLEVGAVDDPLEHEADRVANMVMQVPDHGTRQVARDEGDTEPMPSIHGGQEKTAGRKGIEDEDEPPKSVHGGQKKSVGRKGVEDEDERFKKTAVARKCICGEDHEHIQRTAEVPLSGGLGVDGPKLVPEVETRIQAMRGDGQALTSSERAFMEPRFGADFSAIRIHTNQEADAHSRALHARAFTVGSDIFFRAGEYTPGKAEGHRLLAHELTHTIQQGAASPLGDQHLDARSTARLLQRQPPPGPPPPGPPPPVPVAAAPAGLASVNFLPVLMDQAPGGWGVTTEDDAVIDITAFASGATWKCVITKADQQAHQGVRLLPGVAEVTPALVAGEANCATLQTMITSLNTVANQGADSGFYMLSAVQAHENLHITQYRADLAPHYATLKTAVEALTVPLAGNADAAAAKTAIKALPAYTAAMATFHAGDVAANNKTASHTPMAPFKAAEHGVVDPMINTIKARRTALGCAP